MYKRVIAAFCVISLSLCGLIFRIVDINAKDYAQTANRKNTKSIAIEKQRGIIYDCNYKKLTNDNPQYYLAVKPSSVALKGVKGKIEDKEFKKLTKNLADGKPTLIKLDNEIKEVEDTRVVRVNRRYSDTQIATHVIGYTNKDGNGVSGIERSYNDLLNKDNGYLKVCFSADALGHVLPGTKIEVVQETKNPDKGIVLTIDTNLQKITENALDNKEIDRGCAVLMDVNTGEIKAMASRPAYDPYNPGESLNKESSPFLNRCLKQYSVGSIFKPIVACSAIEDNNISPNKSYYCNGHTEKTGIKFNCYHNRAHGRQDMQKALVNSCNTYFVELANEIEMQSLLDMCKKMGLNKKVEIANGMVSDKGNLPKVEELNSGAAIANFSFGQGKLLATPIQMASAYCSFANGGNYVEPYLVKGVIDDKGHLTQQHESKKKVKVMSKSTSQKMTTMLKAVVDEHSNAKPINSTGCGKTATAQSGWFKGSYEVCHTWFVGYFPADKPKYAVAIMKEHGVTGTEDCAPVFKEIVENVTYANG